MQAWIRGFLARKQMVKLRLILGEARAKRRKFIHRSERALILMQGVKGLRRTAAQEANLLQI